MMRLDELLAVTPYSTLIRLFYLDSESGEIYHVITNNRAEIVTMLPHRDLNSEVYCLKVDLVKSSNIPRLSITISN